MGNIRSLRINTKIVNNEHGVSLVEMMVVCATIIVIFSAVLAVVDASLKNYLIQSKRAASQDTVTTATELMEKEIRQATSPITDPYTPATLYMVQCISNSEVIQFKADIDDNAVLDDIRYEYDRNAKTIIRQVDPTGTMNFISVPKKTMATNVVNPTNQPVFTYFGTNLTVPLVDYVSYDPNVLTRVREIHIYVSVDEDTTKPPSAATVEAAIRLRNFHD